MIAVTASTSHILAASISAANQIVKNKQSTLVLADEKKF
jgi:hypothetical protein